VQLGLFSLKAKCGCVFTTRASHLDNYSLRIACKRTCCICAALTRDLFFICGSVRVPAVTNLLYDNKYAKVKARSVRSPRAGLRAFDGKRKKGRKEGERKRERERGAQWPEGDFGRKNVKTDTQNRAGSGKLATKSANNAAQVEISDSPSTSRAG